MVDALNFKDFVAFLSAFSSKASTHQKIERMSCLFLYSSDFYVLFYCFRFYSSRSSGLVFG